MPLPPQLGRASADRTHLPTIGHFLQIGWRPIREGRQPVEPTVDHDGVGKAIEQRKTEPNSKPQGAPRPGPTRARIHEGCSSSRRASPPIFPPVPKYPTRLAGARPSPQAGWTCPNRHVTTVPLAIRSKGRPGDLRSAIRRRGPRPWCRRGTTYRRSSRRVGRKFRTVRPCEQYRRYRVVPPGRAVGSGRPVLALQAPLANPEQLGLLTRVGQHPDAELDTLVADRHARAADQPLNGAVRLSAKRTLETTRLPSQSGSAPGPLNLALAAESPARR